MGPPEKKIMKAALLTFIASTAEATKWFELEGYTYSKWVAEYKPWHAGNESVFNANLDSIRAHNKDETSTWKQGVNQFTGMTKGKFFVYMCNLIENPTTCSLISFPLLHLPCPISADEFRATLSGYKTRHAQAQAARDLAQKAPLESHVPLSALPASLDWREKGVVTPVKDQGQCGGCWSFSSAETSESFVAIATKKLMVFSEQQILSCSVNPLQCGGTGGCSGATQEIAFNYSSVDGLTLEKDYPYRAQTGKCDRAKIKPAAHIKGFVFLPPNNYSALMNAVVQEGPIAISAAAEPWQSYESGVFKSDCGSDVDHAIVLVGYGTDPKDGGA